MTNQQLIYKKVCLFKNNHNLLGLSFDFEFYPYSDNPQYTTNVYLNHYIFKTTQRTLNLEITKIINFTTNLIPNLKEKI